MGPATAIHYSWPGHRESSGGTEGQQWLHSSMSEVQIELEGLQSLFPGLVRGGPSLGRTLLKKEPAHTGCELYQPSP